MSREANFWKQLRTNSRSIDRKLLFTRVENSAMPGTPDVFMCDESGRFHLIELKTTSANAVRLSPHQVSFLMRHSHASCWIAIKKQTKKYKPVVYLFSAGDAIALAKDGIGGATPVAAFPTPVDWRIFFNTIAPLN